MTGNEIVILPLLFSAVFFESFLLVTLLSKPAREARARKSDNATPSVAIIVPCWNEETTIGGTIESLLALDYPADKLSLILVNDGSVDGTAATIDRYASHPQITALHKENGGKYSAMNLGLAHTPGAELIGFLDADSSVAPDALREIVAAFADPEIAAVTASLSIREPKTIMQRMQYAEYVSAITVRHILASLNGLYVTPGPFSFYRRSTLDALGEFRHAYLAEDMEMAMRIQRAGMKIGNALRARVYTKGPPTFPKLIKQRTRWVTGFLRNILFEYRDLFGNRTNPVLGFLVLPLATLAIGVGIISFGIMCATLGKQLVHTISVVSAAPLSFAFALHSINWFYLPITAILLTSIILLIGMIAWMFLGKYLSRTPGRLLPNIPFYILLYSFIAPIWIINSVSHVARGVRTVWR